MSRTGVTFPPPVPEAKRWIQGITFPDDRPLLNVSQAAPVDPPPLALREAMAETILNTAQAHLYGPVFGLPELRSEIAEHWSRDYGGDIRPDQISITSGCNQAFCTAISVLCGEGDEIILPTPWYFNHKMWLDMAGVRTVPLATGPGMMPDPEQARAILTPRTRAIVLVSPNNPVGVEYPSELVHAFRDLARMAGIALIIDETYRDFHSQSGAPHRLFADPDWDETVIQLYSFSKSFRLTGHRVGALLTSPARLAQAEKFLDTVTICPAQVGQYAALWGIRNLQHWLAGERREILDRAQAIRDGFPVLAARGWNLRGLGAYFAYLRHPFALSARDLARRMVTEASILALPGDMFMPENNADGAEHLRIAFANIDRAGIETLFARLAELDLPLRG